jgi:hypothetical protein
MTHDRGVNETEGLERVVERLTEKYAHYKNPDPGTAVADLQDLLYRLEILEEMKES